jgi:hypothetical protein
VEKENHPLWNDFTKWVRDVAGFTGLNVGEVANKLQLEWLAFQAGAKAGVENMLDTLKQRLESEDIVQ